MGYIYWSVDILIFSLILYSVVTVPYRISFNDEEDIVIEIIDYITDSLFIVDIILSFFTAYYDKEENLVRNRTKIVENYLKTWFTLDFISSFPFGVFLDTAKNYNNLGRILRLPKFYRLIKIFK